MQTRSLRGCGAPQETEASPGQQSLPALCLCAAGAWSYKGGKHSAALRGRLAAEVQGAEIPGRVGGHGAGGVTWRDGQHEHKFWIPGRPRTMVLKLQFLHL